MESPRRVARWSGIAYNQATASDNRIHSDEVARQYGFHGGLVPGVTVYAYLVQPAVEEIEGSPSCRYTIWITTETVGKFSIPGSTVASRRLGTGDTWWSVYAGLRYRSRG